jgi:hypothetical protein
MNLVGELFLDLATTNDKVIARIFAPEEKIPGELWICRFEIGEPINISGDMNGSTSLQSLSLALQCLSASLYGSAEYKAGKLGILGEFGGYLTIPAPRAVLEIAPFPF